MSVVDPTVVAKLIPKEEKLSGKLKIKKTLPKPAKPKDTESSGKPDDGYVLQGDIFLIQVNRWKAWREQSKSLTRFTTR